jgi:uncharacterized cupredoxin-like copper-binding protein
VAGCGSSNKSDTSGGGGGAAPTTTQAQTTTTPAPAKGGGGSTLKLSADPGGNLKFDKSSLSAKAGKVTLAMSNPASVPHAIAVKGSGVTKAGDTVGNGGTSTISVDLKPGKYEFYCPVPGHEQAGMKGTLTVK